MTQPRYGRVDGSSRRRHSIASFDPKGGFPIKPIEPQKKSTTENTQP